MSVYAKVSFEVVRASSLLGMNIGGTSNPFVKVEIGKTNFTTPTIDNTNAPNWREAGHQAQSTFSFPAVHVPTVVTISVFNKLPYGDNLSDFIGQASVTIMKPGQNQQTIPLTHGGNMQLANKAPTGCGMIEVSYNAEEVSETEYFDALLGKSSTSTPVVVPMATIPDMAGNSTTTTNPVNAEQQQQNQMPAANASTTSNPIAATTADGQQQQQQQQPPAAAATTTTASSVNLTPSTSSVGDAAAPPPAADGDAANSTLPPQQQQQQPQPEATPDVSIVADGQQQQQQPTTITSLPQQHQIPALGGGLGNNGDQQQQQQQQQLPPLPPTQSGAMPSSLDSFSASTMNNQQQPNNTITVQAPASSNAIPVPQPQAQFGYIPQVQQQQQVMTTGPAPSSSRSNMFSQNTRASSTGRAPSSGRPAASRPHSAGGNNNTSMMMNNNNHNSSVMSHHNKSAMMNHSTIAAQSNAMNSSSINIQRTTKSERLASVAARWFEMIRSGGNTAGNALREIRSSSEKDPSIVLEACDAAGRTLLHEAAYSGTIELFQELLSLAIRAGNTRGTAMSMQLWASEQHNISAWSTVPPDGYQGPKYVTVNGGNTVLHTAATAGRSDMVDWMLRQGAVFVAMAQTRNKRGLRPLESAAERGHLETAKILARSTTA